MLLLLAVWMLGAGGGSAHGAIPAEPGSVAVAVASGLAPGFTRLAPSLTGILASNLITADLLLTNSIISNGSGVAAGDIDGDGWIDLYFCSIEGGNHLYRNLGNWKFADITSASGVACSNQWSTGAVLADVDGDRDLDLLVNSIGGGTRLFLNDGQGRFHESMDSGLSRTSGATTLTLADVDGDGDLDLYVTHYRTDSIHDMSPVRYAIATLNGKSRVSKVNGVPVEGTVFENRFIIGAGGSIIELGEPDQLYRNDGRGHFQKVPFDQGDFLDEDGKPFGIPRDWGLAAMFRDLNGDGAPDLYVCNDHLSEDRMWINDGRGKFRAPPRLTLRHTALSAMGIDFADIDRDGHVDFLVLDMLAEDRAKRLSQLGGNRPDQMLFGGIESRPQFSRNALFLNRGDGTFAEIGQLAGIDATDWSWTPVFLDVDLDGFEDLLVTTGFPRDVHDSDTTDQVEAEIRQGRLSQKDIAGQRRLYPAWPTSTRALRNDGKLGFSDRSTAWGFNATGVHYGMALADLDNDGDLDVILNCLNSPAAVFRNNCSAPRIGIRLSGTDGNAQGIGAKITVTGGPVRQSQEVISGGRYLSGDDPMRVFATAAAKSVAVEVRWRSGRTSRLDAALPDHVYTISEQQSTVAIPGTSAVSGQLTLFTNVSTMISHIHSDAPFSDWQAQPLLPHRRSQLGPGVAWGDVNGDGWEDLLIGAGRGGSLAVLFSRSGRSFEGVAVPEMPAAAPGDLTSLLIFSDEPRSSTLLAGVSAYEAALTQGIHGLHTWPGGVDPVPVSSLISNVTSMAAADLDGDGDLDLVVCSDVRAGRYPESQPPLIFRRNQGRYDFDAANSATVSGAGLVNTALWSDLDGDGYPELLLACEWGPIRVFKNRTGTLSETNLLGSRTGWWSGMAAGDFDGDGRMDIVVGNWGRNNEYRPWIAEELRLVWGDLNGSGSIDLLEAVHSRTLDKDLPWRDLKTLASSLPFIREAFPHHSDYVRSSLRDLLGERLSRTHELRAATLDSMLFLNRGDHFDAVALPVEAQFAPVFGVTVADFDGDGAEDLFLSQNFFGVRETSTREDAGRGLLLLGNAKGAFRAIPGQDCGVLLYGEQRGCAVADFDHDGRMDLCVGQNSAATQLLRNQTATPGTRVLLQGRMGNVRGVGAQIRLALAGQPMGPAKEIHAGSGWWSQDATTVILPRSRTPTQLQVRWPGGQTTVHDVPAEASTLEASWKGTTKSP